MNRRLFRLLILAVSLGLCLSAGTTIVGLLKRRNVVNDRKLELSAIKSKNQAMEKELEDMQRDGYVERIARDKLGLVKEGEMIVLMPMKDVKGREASGSGEFTLWQQWWRLFF